MTHIIIGISFYFEYIMAEKLFGKRFQLDDPTSVQEFFELEGHIEKCGTIVATAARIAAEMIFEGEE